MTTIRNVVSNDICVGCGACSVRTDGAVPIKLNEFGYFSADLSAVPVAALEEASQVCPFAREAASEDQLSTALFPSAPYRDERIGHYEAIHAGRVSSQDYLNGSSSGGLTSWLAAQLLSRGDVDGVIHVGRGGDGLFTYLASHTIEELHEQRKSAYYSTTLAPVLSRIRGNGRRYVLVGVPCFIKAARLLGTRDPVLAEQLVYTVGLVCGHLKSAAFAEFLSWQVGVSPDQIEAVDFRVKSPDRDAGSYDFAVLAKGAEHWRARPTQSLQGGNWGHGMFQLNACNYCDDIFAETADVVFGDAWLPQYRNDWRGTNIVVSRNNRISELLQQGVACGAIELDDISAETAAASQGGNFRHRREGLAVRLADDLSAGAWTPNKRVKPNASACSAQRQQLVRKRRELSSASHRLFQQAKRTGSLAHYQRTIAPLIRSYEATYRPSLPARLQARLKRYLQAALHLTRLSRIRA